MAGAAVGKVERKTQPTNLARTSQHGTRRTRAVGMLYRVLTTAPSTEIWSREHKNSGDIEDLGNGSSPEYGGVSSNAKFLADF